MKKLCSILPIVLLCYFTALSQGYPSVYQVSNKEDLDVIPNNVIQLESIESEQMVVSISFDKKQWRKFVLYKNKPLFVNLKNSEQAVLRVCTYGVDDCLLHDVFGSNEYRTFWNDRIQMWDLDLALKTKETDIYNLPPEYKQESITKENQPKELAAEDASSLAKKKVVKDRNGNEYTFQTMADGKNWLTKNLNVQIPGSYTYLNKYYYSENYGRLYTWKAAKKACASLGAGWRLPSEEEWASLVEKYKGSAKSMYADGAFESLKEDGESGFKALLAGLRYTDGSFYFEDKSAFFWTSSQQNSVHAWYYYFDNRQGLLQRKAYEKTRAYSCRCIQD